MSNRSLIEINHDFAGEIDRADTEFVIDLVHYLRSAGEDSRRRLERYGVHVFGMKHHSDDYRIEWGGRTSCLTTER